MQPNEDQKALLEDVRKASAEAATRFKDRCTAYDCKNRQSDVRRRDERTYFVVVDTDAFRDGVARLLAEVQRIKSEGDYAAAKELFETYGVHFDPELRDEVVARVDHLNLPSYTGFVMPKLEPVTDESGAIIDVRISYPCDLTVQMLEYAEL